MKLFDNGSNIGSIPKVFELSDKIVIQGQIHEKTNLVPVPFEFYDFTKNFPYNENKSISLDHFMDLTTNQIINQRDLTFDFLELCHCYHELNYNYFKDFHCTITRKTDIDLKTQYNKLTKNVSKSTQITDSVNKNIIYSLFLKQIEYVTKSVIKAQNSSVGNKDTISNCSYSYNAYIGVAYSKNLPVLSPAQKKDLYVNTDGYYGAERIRKLINIGPTTKVRQYLPRTFLSKINKNTLEVENQVLINQFNTVVDQNNTSEMAEMQNSYAPYFVYQTDLNLYILADKIYVYTKEDFALKATFGNFNTEFLFEDTSNNLYFFSSVRNGIIIYRFNDITFTNATFYNKNYSTNYICHKEGCFVGRTLYTLNINAEDKLEITTYNFKDDLSCKITEKSYELGNRVRILTALLSTDNIIYELLPISENKFCAIVDTKNNDVLDLAGKRTISVIDYNPENDSFNVSSSTILKRDYKSHMAYVDNKTILFFNNKFLSFYQYDESQNTYVFLSEIFGNFLKCGVDSFNRIYLLSADYGIDIYSKYTPTELKVELENDTYSYEGTDIETYATFAALNFYAQNIQINAMLTLSGDAYFKDNNEQSILLSTLESGDNQVDIVVTGASPLEIYITQVD